MSFFMDIFAVTATPGKVDDAIKAYEVEGARLKDMIRRIKEEYSKDDANRDNSGNRPS